MSTKVQNIHDSIDKHHEAQGEGRSTCGLFGCFGDRILTGGNMEIKLEQRLRERSPRCGPHVDSSHTQSHRHYWCQETLAEWILIWPPPERPCQSLSNTAADALSQPRIWTWRPRWRWQRKDWRSWRGLQPHRKNNNINQPGIKPSTKECTWLHMEQRTALSGINGRRGDWS